MTERPSPPSQPLSREEIARRIDSFPRWHYEFDLQGLRTPVAVPGHEVRHRERYRYFFEPLLRLSGGSLRGKRVLDVLGPDWQPPAAYDVVLCLGLLYHVNQPVQLLERAAAANRDLLLIDTTIHPGDDPVLAVRHDDARDPRNALTSSIVFFPTIAAVLEIVRSLGYRALVLRPEFRDLTGSNDVAQGRRRAFLCAKASELSSLAHLAG